MGLGNQDLFDHCKDSDFHIKENGLHSEGFAKQKNDAYFLRIAGATVMNRLKMGRDKNGDQRNSPMEHNEDMTQGSNGGVGEKSENL